MVVGKPGWSNCCSCVACNSQFVSYCKNVCRKSSVVAGLLQALRRHFCPVWSPWAGSRDPWALSLPLMPVLCVTRALACYPPKWKALLNLCSIQDGGAWSRHCITANNQQFRPKSVFWGDVYETCVSFQEQGPGFTAIYKPLIASVLCLVLMVLKPWCSTKASVFEELTSPAYHKALSISGSMGYERKHVWPSAHQLGPQRECG